MRTKAYFPGIILAGCFILYNLSVFGQTEFRLWTKDAPYAMGSVAEIHIFERGDHGIGLAKTDPVLGSWPVLLKGWLISRGVIPGSTPEQ